MARHNELGQWGEDLACQKLIADGYAICERNWRMGHLEIDIIAMKGNRIIFAEVKTRSDMESDPLDAVTPRKISHMVSSAKVYLEINDLHHEVQFDLFAINGSPENYKIEHVADAFEPPLKTY
jgi:putative endonuclease